MSSVERAVYRDGLTFPHLVVDDHLSPIRLAEAYAVWPDADDPAWETFDDEHERGKRQMQRPAHPALCDVLEHLTSVAFTRWISDLTGIPDLIPDLLGGGLHESGPGAYLDVHTDFNVHPEGWHRRVNALLFAVPTWEPNNGGALQLGADADPDGCAIAPWWNRLVVFETNDRSWHGHPEPWRGATPRRSFAAYFYTREPPPIDEPPRGTTWLTD